MKRPVSFNVLYKGERIHTDLSPEECADILQKYSEDYYESASEGKELDVNLITLEETRLWSWKAAAMLKASPRKLVRVVENTRFSRQPLGMERKNVIEVKVAR